MKLNIVGEEYLKVTLSISLHVPRTLNVAWEARFSSSQERNSSLSNFEIYITCGQLQSWE